jgi:NADPH-dependent glutamate synthase beta subunit-like oxidoreductase/NAD(P)H-flavin reductase
MNKIHDTQNMLSDDNPSFKYGFKFLDLFESSKLKELTEIFYNYFKEKDNLGYEKYSNYRNALGEGFNEVETSNAIISSARHLNNFLVDFFDITEDAEKLIDIVDKDRVVTIAKKEFIQRRVFKNLKPADLSTIDYNELNSKIEDIKNILFSDLDWINDEERSTSNLINTFIKIETDYKSYVQGTVKDFKLPDSSRNKLNKYKETLSSFDRAKYLFENISELKSVNSKASEDDCFNFELIKRLVDVLQKWCFARYHDSVGKVEIKKWILYRFPLDMNYDDLVHNKVICEGIAEKYKGTEESLRHRDGFKLTDRRYNDLEVISEVDYCVFCHDRKKDSCSKGLKEKEGAFKRNPLGIKLEGCPLDEKISEMHLLKNEGLSLGALSLIMIDNPMCPGTGHRICNDCMKACIYQKQEPVNIPQIETKVLTDVLSLPFGFEIYSLLTRWNPVNVKRPYALPYNGKNIFVVGMGPAGYTLSHFLLNEGFGVVGVDGLKIEPVHPEYTGYRDENGNYLPPKPVHNFSSIYDELDERVFLGFGGVSEYGITVRWDKNFLKVVYMTLARRKYFRVYDGVRFGGTVEIDDVWELGFDHIAIATGAGKPTIVKMKNNLIRGIRKASDFLMALQLSGAAKKDSITNLQIQMPVVVIGGGLTAIDTGTEAAAYYIIQVEKYLIRFETIVKEFGEEKFWSSYDPEEKEIAETFIAHGKEVISERQKAKVENKEPDFVPLIRKWGGVTVVYRKSLHDSPSYRLNHEEVIKSLEEGIYFWEKLSPVEAHYNDFGSVKEIVFRKQDKTPEGKWIELDEYLTLPAKSVLVAAGTSPNIIYEREYPGTFELDEWKQFFQTYKINSDSSYLTKTGKGEIGFFTSYNQQGKFITVYGDNHPVYAGNVVKAMASARDGFKEICKLFKDEIFNAEVSDNKFLSLLNTLDRKLIAHVEQVNILTPSIVEVIVKAPLYANKFQPGQFYKLQNYETTSQIVDGTKLLMEGLALTGAEVDNEKGLLSMIVLEMWGSSRLCRYLKKGQKVVLMGPTGTPTHIPTGENVLLLGGGLGNAVLFSIAKAMKESGNKVIYFAGYKNSSDLFKQDEVEINTDQVIWSNDLGDKITPRRKQDRSITANIVQAMIAYAKGELEPEGGKPIFDFKEINRMIAIGSDRMMAAVKEARYTVLKDYINPTHVGIGSINSTMQCMMKEVCAQCLQRHVDPVTGKESFVFSCFNQDQLLDHVDFRNLNERLKQNSVLEKLTKFWIDHAFIKSGLIT